MQTLERSKSDGGTTNVRLIGAIVAASIAGAVAIAGWLQGAGTVWMPGWTPIADTGWWFGLLGLPGTTVIAWRLAPRAIEDGAWSAVRVAIQLAGLAIVVTDVILVGGLLGWAAVSAVATDRGPLDLVASVVALVQVAVTFGGMVVLGLLFYGIPAATIVLAAAVGWVASVRRGGAV